MARKVEQSRIAHVPTKTAEERIVPSLECSLFSAVQRGTSTVSGAGPTAEGTRFLCTVQVLVPGGFRGPLREKRGFFAISVRDEFFGEGSFA